MIGCLLALCAVGCACWLLALAVLCAWRLCGCDFCRIAACSLHGLWGDYRGAVDRLGINLLPCA